MLTADEAKKKWCPQRPRADLDHTNCIADECALWQWKPLVWHDTSDKEGMNRAAAKPQRGGCGLAR